MSPPLLPPTPEQEARALIDATAKRIAASLAVSIARFPLPVGMGIAPPADRSIVAAAAIAEMFSGAVLAAIEGERAVARLSAARPTGKALTERCAQIAYEAVPRYGQKPFPSCGGTIAAKWQAAWDGACLALGGDPAEHRG